jgi:hypothetical protein
VLLASGSGLVVHKTGASFRPGHNTQRFLREAMCLEELPWCWHFTNWDRHMETPHGWIQGTLQPAIRAAFATVEFFEFHLWRGIPEFPGWLDAEHIEHENVIAFYGDREPGTCSEPDTPTAPT